MSMVHFLWLTCFIALIQLSTVYGFHRLCHKPQRSLSIRLDMAGPTDIFAAAVSKKGFLDDIIKSATGFISSSVTKYVDDPAEQKQLLDNIVQIINSNPLNQVPIKITELSSEAVAESSATAEKLVSAIKAYDWASALELVASSPYFLPSFTAFVAYAVLAGVGYDDSKIGSPYPEGVYTYDPKQAELFYGSRPGYVLRRMTKLFLLTASFNSKLLMDYLTGSLEKNEKERAKDALALATQLGPTFIKLGQALSIRTDIINEAYALELRKLQDAVPPFDSDEAKAIICREMNLRDTSEVFSEISDKAVASASIGQVYRARLLDGTEVAVKVQRPQILQDISLDLYILRLITPLQVYLTNLKRLSTLEQSDFDNLLRFVDEWGKGLVAEVDYLLEAENTKKFSAAMEQRELNMVMSPKVISQLSSSKVLVTEWVQGTRLDKDYSDDVPRLCGVALNAYLTMLLDTGVLHCDPHPGNLLRTSDGKLCILDWGMTLDVPKDLQYALLEFITHINTEDYNAVPEDFVNMGFTPPDKLERLKNSGVTDGFAFAIQQLSGGGGAQRVRQRLKESLKERYGENLSDEELRVKAQEEMMQQMEDQLQAEGVDVSKVTNMMEEVSKRNREIFNFPPYVLYTTRAFSTLEGIGLSVNEEYAIIQECYPYLAKRLFSDNSPRSQQALRNMLVNRESGLLATDKLLEMTSNFNTYATSVSGMDMQQSSREMSSGSNLDLEVQRRQQQQIQDELIDMILAPEGSMVQDIITESFSNATDAFFRDSVQRLKTSTGGQFVKSALKAPKNAVDRLVPQPLRSVARPFTLPLTLPYDLAKAVVNLAEKSEDDEAVLRTFDNLWQAAQPQLEQRIREVVNAERLIDFNTLSGPPQSLTLENVRKALQDSRVQERLPSILRLGGRISSSILHRAASRVESHMSRSSASAVAPSALQTQPYKRSARSIRRRQRKGLPVEDDTMFEEMPSTRSNKLSEDPMQASIENTVGIVTSRTAETLARVIERQVVRER